MSNGKQYVGRGTRKEGSAYVILHLDLDELMVAESYVTRNGKRMVKAVLAQRANPSVGGTHTIYVVPQEDREEQRANALVDQQELAWHKE